MIASTQSTVESQDRHVMFVSIPLYGHLGPLLLQGLEMHRRGWRVTIATMEEGREKVERHPELKFLNLGRLGRDPAAAEALVAKVTAEPDFVKGLMMILAGLGETWEVMFDGLMAALPADRPDLMVVDLASTAGFDAAEASGIPFAVNSADLVTTLPAGMLPYDPSLPPLLSGQSLHRRSRLDRALTPLRRLAEVKGAAFTAGRQQNALRRRRGLPPVDFHRRLEGRLVLVNSAFGLEYPRVLPPLIQMVGPMLEAENPDIPVEFAEWLEDPLPVVLVSFGTVSSLSREMIGRVAQGLRSDRFRALWALRRGSQELLPAEVPPNVRVESWLPSMSTMLGHPRVAAFVSHCGTNSVQQAMIAGKPVIGIPLFGVQGDMAVRITDANVGLHLRKDRFTSAELCEAIERVVADPAFRANIPAIRESMRVAGGVSRAADLLESAATVGVGHLSAGWGRTGRT